MPINKNVKNEDCPSSSEKENFGGNNKASVAARSMKASTKASVKQSQKEASMANYSEDCDSLAGGGSYQYAESAANSVGTKDAQNTGA